MTRVCTVCTHPQREAIDRALIGGERYRDIARRENISKDALYRHKSEHLPVHLTRAADVEEEATATGLLARLRALNAETADVLKEARKSADHDLRLKAIARAEKQIELEGRLLGELQGGATVNVVVAPEWLAIRGALLAALRPYPEAAVQVSATLVALEEGAPFGDRDAG
jgi:hypothetical protein